MTDLSDGLDLARLTEITAEEIRANLVHVYSWLGGTYEFGANAVQLYAGMRGLGHTVRAVGAFLPALGDPPTGPAAFSPAGTLTRTRSAAASTSPRSRSPIRNRQNLTAWYERTIGYLPKSIETGLRHGRHPRRLAGRIGGRCIT